MLVRAHGVTGITWFAYDGSISPRFPFSPLSFTERFANCCMNIETERLRTRPDYTAYVPKSLDGSTHHTGNEHFLVFESPDGGHLQR